MLKYLPFDSKLFGKKIGKIVIEQGYSSEKLRQEIKKAIDKYDCCYLEVNYVDETLLSVCRNFNLYQAGTRLLLENNLKHFDSKTTEYDCQEEMINHVDDQFLRDYAQEIYQVTRYYNDPFFKKNGINLFILWVKKSFKAGYAKKYFIEYKGNSPVAGITLRKKDKDLYINLFGVLKKYQRKGFGRKLLNRAIGWAIHNGYQSLHVHTQLSNTAAISAYESMGFRRKALWNIYHIYNINAK